jgi:hypothetical protein
VKHKVVTKFDAALVITIDIGRFVVQDSEFIQQPSNPNHFTGALG